MRLEADILIIGSGLAGLSAALKLADHYQILIVTKKEAMEANTRYAQGGIASVMSQSDNFESHIKDTLIAGDGLCNEEVVRKIIEDGPQLIHELIELGVQFSKNEASEFDLGREGGHSERRVLHAGDMTGNELESVFLKRVKSHPQIRLLENHTAIDLIKSENKCHGAYVFDQKENQIHTLLSKASIIASGGAGKVYLYTSNPDVATGDGIAMAYRAGAQIQNMEFVQFHPTCYYNPGAWSPQLGDVPKVFLISEAIRGEGGQLFLQNGKSFMENYDKRAELSSRDIVARAIDSEMKKNGDQFVYLDISHEEKDFIIKRFPKIYETCLLTGLDITKSPIPVVPAAHYFCGGIATDLNGRSSIKNLYAIGEAACTGLHGANRLASNSLLEALALADYASQDILKNLEKSQINAKIQDWDPGKARKSQEEVMISQNWDEVRRLMWNYVGIVRSDKRLKLALKRVTLLQDEIKDYYWQHLVHNNLIELRNLVCVSEIIIRSALQRKESRGLHYNKDYPQKSKSEIKNTFLQIS